MSRTPDSVARCPEHDEHPTNEEQALEDQLTQEQFDNELEKDLEVMLTQEQCDEEEGGAEGRAGEAAEAKKKWMMMMMTQKRDMKVPRILSYVKPEGGQQRKIWTWILTRTRG